jgi:hypothetical protein
VLYSVAYFEFANCFFLKDVATQVRIQYLGSLLVVCSYLSLGFNTRGAEPNLRFVTRRRFSSFAS